jgi:phosphoenolpyruvate---glycerone phosphotransferase subunit DhaL
VRSDVLTAVIAEVADVMIQHADELTDLDRAIGDGDHGTNVRRGFQAVLKNVGGWRDDPPPAILEAMGRTLVLTVGGAFGPLVGTALMTLGRSLPSDAGAAGLSTAAHDAMRAVKARGRSDVGHKTLVDVLEPVCEGLAKGADAAALKELALRAAERTVDMQARRGRAAFFGERSIGHMDPGARSVSLMISAAVDAFATTRPSVAALPDTSQTAHGTAAGWKGAEPGDHRKT